MKKILTIVVTAVTLLTVSLPVSAANILTYLTTSRGFTQVNSTEDIIGGDEYCYILTAAEKLDLIVGAGPYEAKPAWAGEDTKALRYKTIINDPVYDMSNFFTIEKSGEYIGLRNMMYSSSFFQTHENAGYMYVLTYTEPTLSDWCYLIPTYQGSYWIFESGKYPMSSEDWACGYLGPWNKKVAAGEPLALNRKNTSDDKAGHYRLYRIDKATLVEMYYDLWKGGKLSKSVDFSSFINNPSFETGDESGWTLSGKDQDGDDDFKVCEYDMTNKQGNYLMNAFKWWAPSLSVSQTVTGLPSGQYTLSGVVATWSGRYVTFSGNETSTTRAGFGDGTGFKIVHNINIGPEGKLAIYAGSAGEWWLEGHESETETFFKLDDVQLKCKALFLDGLSFPLNKDKATTLMPGLWYRYDVDYSTEYRLIGNIENIIYSNDGEKTIPEITTAPAERQMMLQRGRIYFQTQSPNVTLRVTPCREIHEGRFTAVALNVDGLPKEINYVVGKYELNPDGPGADGTRKISQYLASKGYDFIGCSEDFNYNGALMESLNDNYWCGTIRKTLSVGDLDYGELIKGNLHVETDGLNLVWKFSRISAENESWTRWWDTEATDGNQYVEKGYRHYDVSVGGCVFDVFILHMDAGNTNATWSRESQWRQLAGAINGSDPIRPKLIIGDTNSRWTREDIKSNFMDLLNTNLKAGDVWVELYRNGVYPNVDMGNIGDNSDPSNFSNYEVVDKIIYINPTDHNTMQLIPQSFRIEQDYTYGNVEGNDNSTPLGDHNPVVVEFKYFKAGDIIPVEVVRGDANGDGVVNGTDIQDVINFIIADQYDSSADVNEDGKVNGTDIQEVINIIVNAD
jgi:hypothetical protein